MGIVKGFVLLIMFSPLSSSGFSPLPYIVKEVCVPKEENNSFNPINLPFVL